MNNVIAIIPLVILAVILIVFLRMVIPALSGFLKQIPKGTFIFLFLVVVGLMIYLIYYIATYKDVHGNPGNPDTSSPETVESSSFSSPEQRDDVIVLRGDKIIINGTEVTLKEAEEFIDERVEGNIEITITDDYSLASLYHKISGMCIEKGAKFITEDGQ